MYVTVNTAGNKWVRTIFVWPWNEKARTKQKQQTNGNRAIWCVYRMDRNARVTFWLVKRTLGWKNFIPENFLETSRCFALTSYCNTIGKSNNAFSIFGFSLAGKRSPCFDLFAHWVIKQITSTFRNQFSRSYETRSLQRTVFKKRTNKRFLSVWQTVHETHFIWSPQCRVWLYY